LRTNCVQSATFNRRNRRMCINLSITTVRHRCHRPATSGRPRCPRRSPSVRFRQSAAGCYKRAARTWRKGRRKGLKIPWEQSRVGSIPTVRTMPARDVPDRCVAAISLIITTKKQAGSCCNAAIRASVGFLVVAAGKARRLSSTKLTKSRAPGVTGSAHTSRVSIYRVNRFAGLRQGVR
jgi:hypothetical protein